MIRPSVESNDSRPDGLIYRLKKAFKKFPKVFFLLYYSIAFFVGKTAKSVIVGLPTDAVIISVGSGAKVIDRRVVNVDIEADENVHVVASVYALPYADNSVAAVISESLLEHLEFPEIAAREIYRVLKPGGLLYIVTPFMLGFHSSPHDYYRWTVSGMKILLKDFFVEESGIAVGPTGALTAILREWLAMLFSFGSRTLYQLWTLFFMILFIPINVFDLLLVHFPFAATIAHSYYFIAKKPTPIA